MKLMLAGYAAAVFAFVTVATAPVAAASPDNEFLDALEDSGLSFPPHAALGVINAGHNVCQGFSAGDSYEDAVAGVAARGLGGNRSLAGVFVRTAASSLCPKYMSQLP
jgi:Protein of unknown function (DUF732)